jgi:hypothetical protein
VAILSKAWICSRSLSEIVDSNLAGGMDVLSLVSVVCCQVEVSAWGLITCPESYRVRCVCVMCLSVVSECDLETSTEFLDSSWLSSHGKKKMRSMVNVLHINEIEM